MPAPEARSMNRKVVIVGPCASGKSTLVRNLRARGVDAHVSGQEHSEIRNLWQRQQPDVVIGLILDLDTLRERRGATWSQALYDTQQRRLEQAYAVAEIVLHTGELGEEEVVERVMMLISGADAAESASG